jgi:hypothetical protein
MKCKTCGANNAVATSASFMMTGAVDAEFHLEPKGLCRRCAKLTVAGGVINAVRATLKEIGESYATAARAIETDLSERLHVPGYERIVYGEGE